MKRVVVFLIVMASACGGAAVPSTSTTTATVDSLASQTSIEDAVLSVVDAVVAVHGEEGGFDAVIWASERGYSGEQLIAAALEGRLEADGMIADATGVAEAPVGSPLGLIELPDAEIQSMGAMAMRAGNRTSSVMPTRLRQIPIDELDRREAAERDMLTEIVLAIFSGYTLEQIVLNILEGGVFDRLEQSATASCLILVDSAGQTIVPETAGNGQARIDSPASHMYENDVLCHSDIKDRSDADKIERERAADGEPELATSTVPDHPFPWTYEGTVSYHASVSLDFGAQDGAEYDNERPVRITLYADGTIEGSMGGASLTSTATYCDAGSSNPAGSFSVRQVDVAPVDLIGTHGGGIFTIFYFVPGFPDIEGTYTPQEVDAYWEDSRSHTACDGAGTQSSSTTATFTLIRTDPPPP